MLNRPRLPATGHPWAGQETRFCFPFDFVHAMFSLERRRTRRRAETDTEAGNGREARARGETAAEDFRRRGAADAPVRPAHRRAGPAAITAPLSRMIASAPHQAIRSSPDEPVRASHEAGAPDRRRKPLKSLESRPEMVWAPNAATHKIWARAGEGIRTLDPTLGRVGAPEKIKMRTFRGGA